MSAGSAFLALWNDIERGREPEYNTWHTREHVPERVASPGFRSGCRYVDRDHPVHRYFTLYEVDSLDAFHTPEYRDLLQNPTPWSASMRPSFRNFLRVPCALRQRAGHGHGAALAVIRFACDAAQDAIATRLTALAEAPGIVAATLGGHVGGTPRVAWSGPAPVDDGTEPFDSVLVLEALDRPAAARGFDAALTAFGIPRGSADIGGVYDLAFIFPGGDAGERLAHRRPGWGPAAPV
jgi:hypothetical protein